MNSKKILKKSIKLKEEDKNASSLNALFSELSEQLKVEEENNKVFKFKKSLSESASSITKKYLETGSDLFFHLPEVSVSEEPKTVEYLAEEILLQPEPSKEEPPKEVDFITSVVNSITREESNKSIKENTDLFNQPNSKLSDPTIKSLQDKVKLLEDWVYKISAAGPGGGEVNFRWLDDVNRDTIGNTDQLLRYNPSDKKFFFGQLSGDQGKIRSLQFEESGSGIPTVPGMITWNTEKDCLDVYQKDNTTLQVGLESYVRVYNNSGNTLNNGTVVRFAGVDTNSITPICVPMIANSTSVPLYTIGVLTNDVANNDFGRATVLGEVRNLNTTGTPYNEVWNVGDLLWASPSISGGFTKTRPTAPNTVISVAAVLKKDNSNGVLLVRPTIYERHYYGSFYDTTHQATTANTATPVKLNSIQVASGFHIANGSQIVAENAGLYNYQFSLQVSSTTSSTQYLAIWYRKNGKNVNNSSTVISLDSNKSVVAPAWNFIESMNAGDNFELMWAPDSPSLFISNNVATIDNSPSIPSVILTVTQVAL